MSECLFCQSGFQSQKLAENDFFYIVADQSPVGPGHLLVIPKRHIETYFELEKQEADTLWEMLSKAKEICRSESILKIYQKVIQTSNRPKVVKFCQEALENWEKPITGYNIGINNGLSAGQTIFHLHIHLIPRFDGDIADPTGGVRFVIPEKANYRN